MARMFHNNNGGVLSRYLIAFCVITTGLCIAEGIFGSWLLPDGRLPYSAYFVPPFFGALTSLTGLVMESRKVLSVWQIAFRLFLQWLLILGLVFGINLVVGYRFTPMLAGVVVAEITVIFAFVYLVMWVNERRIASAFNRKLADMQDKMHEKS